jgi:hypothetical protein
MPKTPQDHQPKAADAAYSFTVADDNGKPRTYRLPPGETAVSKIPGKFLRDAYMDGDEGQMRLGFAMLEAVDADQGALDALYAMPAPEMLEHVQAWMSFKPSEEDASLGESSSSSE